MNNKNNRYELHERAGLYLVWDTLLSRPISQHTTRGNAEALVNKFNEQEVFKREKASRLAALEHSNKRGAA